MHLEYVPNSMGTQVFSLLFFTFLTGVYTSELKTISSDLFFKCTTKINSIEQQIKTF